jgi:transposase
MVEVLHERCAGLDVHRDTVVTCVITPEVREVRTFGTTTDRLLELADWLAGLGVTHVAMESTGVFWKPVHDLLEGGGIELLVVNARHMRAVPGRKTDVRDAEWIADLLRHGLLRASFIPDRPQRELRELVRYRRSLIEERSREAARLHKVLEGANIKLGAVASDLLGVSGRAMLDAIAAGRDDPETLAGLARGRMRDKHDRLVGALRGLLGEHQRRMLGAQLRHIDFLDAEVGTLSADIAERMRLSARPSRSSTRSRASRSGALRPSSRRSARTCPASPRPRIWRRGRGCVRATTRARADGARVPPARATTGCGQPWWRPPTRRHAPRGRISRRSTSGSRPGGAAKERPSRWPTRSSSSSTTCSEMARCTGSSARPGSTSGTGRPPSGVP